MVNVNVVGGIQQGTPIPFDGLLWHVKVGHGGDATQQIQHQLAEGQLGGQAATDFDAGRREETQRQFVAGRVRETEGFAAQDHIISGEGFGLAGVNGTPVLPQAGDVGEFELAFAATNAHETQLVERVDEIRQIFDGPPHEHQPKLQPVAFVVDTFGLRRRLHHKRLRTGFDAAHKRRRFFRDGRFKELRIGTFELQEAGLARNGPHGADHFAKGMTEATAQGRAFVLGQVERFQRFQAKAEFGEV